MIVNLHRKNTKNIGDLVCAPYLYFPFIDNSNNHDLIGFKQGESPTIDQRKSWVSSVANASAIVVGGGGLLGLDFFAPGFQRLKAERRADSKAIIWGAGHNSWKLGDWRMMKHAHSISRDDFDLIGVRDFNSGYDWVPCVSCMAPEIEQLKDVGSTREIGMYLHSGSLNNPNFKSKFPKNLEFLSNSSKFTEALEFISSCETLLTDSFHGAYWGVLLGKKVVAFPTSSKFYSYKHPVPLCAPEDWERFSRMAIRYTEALDECRTANLDFAEKVRDLIGIS